MSAPTPLKAVSHRESLAKTVRMLTRDGIPVLFRGHQPHVATKGNKAIRLVLPELNDTASPELLEAIQGFLDHEVGHIFYTPFARATKAGTVDKKAPALINIVEDIRLEKLLPRDLPGTKENLERMYDRFIPMMIHPATSQMVASGNPSKMFAGVMVPAMRALAGQKAFQDYMDANSYWPHFMPLLAKMPDLARRLKAMETFDDVEAIVTDVLASLAPPKQEEKPKPKAPPQKPQESDDGDEGDDDSRDDDNASDGDESGPDDDAGDDEGDDGDAEPGDDGEPGDDDGDAGGDDEGGEGHGDGSGTDDGEGDEEDNSSSGDSDDEGGNGDDGGEDLDGKDERSGPNGNGKLSITDALKQLEPTQRKALFMYKQSKKTVSEIASELQSTEDVVLDLLRNARRRLGELMKGAR